MPETDLKTAFAGRVAIVTGGTQGLGEATARLLAARGAKGLFITGRNAERGARVAAELTRSGCRTVFVAAALENIDEVRKIVPAAMAAFDAVHILVNAAASTERGTILETSPELFDRIFAINVRAPFFLIQDAALAMRRNSTPGAIINVLSMSSHGGQPFLSAYSTSKGALATLTRNAAFALLPDRIRVIGLNIGWMDSPGEHAIQTQFHGRPADWLVAAEEKQPLGRLLKPDEVARAICFLASAEAGLMTGSLIDFDQSVLGACEATPHPSGRLADPG